MIHPFPSLANTLMNPVVKVLHPTASHDVWKLRALIRTLLFYLKNTCICVEGVKKKQTFKSPDENKHPASPLLF